MNFEFYTAGRIVFGPGTISQLPQLVAERGQRCLLVTGAHALAASGALEQLERSLAEQSVTVQRQQVACEPTVSMIDQAVADARAFEPDVVVALGGGSVIDLAKAVAGLLTNGGSVLDYLEGVGKGAVIDKPALPVIAAHISSRDCLTRNSILGLRSRSSGG